MAKKKAGIFDPWRQERPEPVAALEPTRVDVAADVVLASSGGPVRFAGKRGGLSVWLSGDDPALVTRQAQTNVLAAILHLMNNKALFSLFENGGISGKERLDGAAPRTVMSDGERVVVVLGEYEKAMDAITHVFREATRRDPRVGEYLLSMGIRPYLV